MIRGQNIGTRDDNDHLLQSSFKKADTIMKIANITINKASG